MLTSFRFLLISLLNLFLIKDRQYLSQKVRFPKLSKKQCRKNKLLSISKRTRSPFMETENYLLVYKIGIGIGIGMLYFMLTKIIEKKKHMHKMHNTSSSS